MRRPRVGSPVRPARRSVDVLLRRYADRGVFRGFGVSDGAAGVRRYRFNWLTRRPMTVTLSRDRRVLCFPALFPSVTTVPGLAAALRRELQSKTAAPWPAHRRVDPRQATMMLRLARGGDLTLRVVLEGRTGDAAVRRVLGIVNDLFLHLHEWYPDYLATHFGVSQE